MVFLVLLGIPLLVAAGGFFFSKGLVTRKELALQVGVQFVVAAVAALIVHYSPMHDTEVWNGTVVKKERDEVTCEHTYDCNCHTTCTGSGKKRSCSEHCDTCRRHSFDVDWNVYTSNGESLQIERLDDRGIDEPPRWTSIAIGDPTAIEHGYTNYIKAAPDTLFRHQGQSEKYAALIPKYPGVYDYYRINRIVLVNGARVPEYQLWNDTLSKIDAEVGRPRQANVVVVLARGMPQDYYYALEEAWVGAKKNDIVAVVGVDDQLVPQWATIMCWTTQEIFKVKLRDSIMSGSGPLTAEKLMGDIKTNVEQSYVRKPMADFQYLEASITPTPTQWVVSLIVCFIVQIILTIVCIKNDIFGDERRMRAQSYLSDIGFESSFRSRRRKGLG